MATLKNHPGKWLRDDAAAAFNAAEDKHGVFVVNSAGRTLAEQQALIDRWNRGGKYNRPPFLFQPAMPARTSNHVQGGGVAVDLDNWRDFKFVCAEFGFRHTYPSGDPVHFDFVGWTPPKPKPPQPKPPETNIPTTEDEDDMATCVGHYVGGTSTTPAKDRLNVIYYPGSGFFFEFSGADQVYINSMAAQHKTGNFTHISQQLWNNIKATLAETRKS